MESRCAHVAHCTRFHFQFSLKVGTEVLFAGGLMGKVKKIDGEYAVVALNNQTEVKVQRASVISVLPTGTIDAI